MSVLIVGLPASGLSTVSTLSVNAATNAGAANAGAPATDAARALAFK